MLTIVKGLSLSTFLISALLIVLMVFVLIKNSKSPVNLSFALVCLSAAIWLFSYSQAYNSSYTEEILFWFKVGYPGVVFIAITYLHFANVILKIKSTRKIIIFSYIVGFFMAYLIWTSNFIVNGLNEFKWGFYPKAGKLHPYFLMIFLGLVNAASAQIGYTYFLKRKEFASLTLQQLKYILLAFGIFTLASIDFIPNYGINILPLGFIPVTIFLSIICYSIIKYRLMDISLAITRTGIFLVVYSFVLGIPFAIAFGCREFLFILFNDNWWIIPLVSSTILATGGPYIYLYIQKQAENNLLKEQRQYQSTLRQASLGMGRIKDLKKLLQLIVHIVARAVRIEHCEIYLLHEASNQYVLKASKGRLKVDQVSVLPIDSILVKEMIKIKEPFVYDEINQRSHDYQDKNLSEIEQIMKNLDGALLVPSFIEERLIAIIVLGKKKSGKLYSHDDLAVFSILANQSALAIENAQFYEDMKKTHEQLFRAEKMATIGTMADGLSHQINNRLHAMGFIAGDALDTIRIKKKEALPEDIKIVFEDIEHSLDRIQDNVKRGGEIVEGLLKYTRKGEEGFSPVDLDKLFDASFEMAQFKIKVNEIDVVKNFNETTPQIYGNFTQLQEVLFNIIDNSYDAMVQRKNDLKEPNYRGRLEVNATKKGRKIEIVIKDNGMGVKEEDLNKLFAPFFTTKLSSKKGTGLGLYVIRQIIEENHGGKVEFLSKLGIGSETHLTLPIVTEGDDTKILS